MSNELINICLRQGEGKEEMRFAMGLPKETVDMMTAIRKENPEKWEHRDLDLLEEANKRLGKV